MGFRQLEWLLRERLRSGLQTIRDNPAKIDLMFPDLTSNSRTHLKQWIRDHEISILLGYPRGMEDVPCWVISMAGESQVQVPIGQNIYHEWSASGEIDEKGELVRKTYQIFTMSPSADLTVILNTILQHILKSMRQDLGLEGFHQMSVAQQGPLDLRIDLLPNYLYARITNITLLVEDTFVEIDSSLPVGFEVGVTLSLPQPPTNECGN